MMRITISIADIERYYDKDQIFYTYIWSRTALHYGLWYPGTSKLSEAIRNTDRLVCQLLDIRPDDVVLDAGCGVGGSSVYIAATTRATVEGITLSRVQLRIAQRMCRRLGLDELVRFSRQDFCGTGFADRAFTKVLGIESVSHALDKSEFVREAFRLLSDGGRLAVCDAFLASDDPAVTNDIIYVDFLKGWALPNLASVDHFRRLLFDKGFTKVVFYDLSPLIERSSFTIYLHGVWMRPFSAIRSLFGSPRRDVAARHQRHLFTHRRLVYGVLVAAKN